MEIALQQPFESYLLSLCKRRKIDSSQRSIRLAVSVPFSVPHYEAGCGSPASGTNSFDDSLSHRLNAQRVYRSLPVWPSSDSWLLALDEALSWQRQEPVSLVQTERAVLRQIRDAERPSEDLMAPHVVALKSVFDLGQCLIDCLLRYCLLPE